MPRLSKKVDKKILQLIESLPLGATVLDLGCGSGANAIFLNDHGFSVSCIDRNSELIQNIKNNYPFIKAKRQDVTKFKFLPKHYDLILALNLLHFFDFKTARSIINKSIKSLKKNGLLYLQVFSTKDPAFNVSLKIAVKTQEKNTFFSKKTQSYIHFFEREELSNLFRKNKVLEIEELLIKEVHLPIGAHKHAVIRVVVKK